jgi:prophage regulatory protein
MPDKKRIRRKPTKEQRAAAAEKKAATIKKLREELGTRLLTKDEVLAVTGVTFPSLWQWMREGRFPRGRIVGGRSMWLSSDIDAWIAALKVRPLKGDADVNTKVEAA